MADFAVHITAAENVEDDKTRYGLIKYQETGFRGYYGASKAAVSRVKVFYTENVSK